MPTTEDRRIKELRDACDRARDAKNQLWNDCIIKAKKKLVTDFAVIESGNYKVVPIDSNRGYALGLAMVSEDGTFAWLTVEGDDSEDEETTFSLETGLWGVTVRQLYQIGAIDDVELDTYQQALSLHNESRSVLHAFLQEKEMREAYEKLKEKYEGNEGNEA